MVLRHRRCRCCRCVLSGGSLLLRKLLLLVLLLLVVVLGIAVHLIVVIHAFFTSSHEHSWCTAETSSSRKKEIRCVKLTCLSDSRRFPPFVAGKRAPMDLPFLRADARDQPRDVTRKGTSQQALERGARERLLHNVFSSFCDKARPFFFTPTDLLKNERVPPTRCACSHLSYISFLFFYSSGGERAKQQ